MLDFFREAVAARSRQRDFRGVRVGEGRGYFRDGWSGIVTFPKAVSRLDCCATAYVILNPRPTGVQSLPKAKRLMQRGWFVVKGGRGKLGVGRYRN